MLIAEYFCNHEWRTMNNSIFSRPYLEFYFIFFVFVFYPNKNIVYLLVKFGKWME